MVQRSGRSSGSSSSSHSSGTETGAPGAGPGAVRGDERLVDGVLRVVEPGQAARDRPCARTSSPARGRWRRRRATSASTHARVWSKVYPSATGTQIWMPRWPVTFGRPDHAEVVERGPVEAGEHEHVVERGRRTRVDVDERPRRLVRRRSWSRSTGAARRRRSWPATPAPAGRRPRSTTPSRRVGVGVAPAGQPVGRVRRHLLVPEARLVDAVGIAVQVDRPAGEVGQHRRARCGRGSGSGRAW